MRNENVAEKEGKREVRGPIWWGSDECKIDENGDVDFSDSGRCGKFLSRGTMMTGYGRRPGDTSGESVETFAKRIGGMWMLRNEDAVEEAREGGESSFVSGRPLTVERFEMMYTDYYVVAMSDRQFNDIGYWLDGARMSDRWLEEVTIRNDRFQRDVRARTKVLREGRGIQRLPE